MTPRAPRSSLALGLTPLALALSANALASGIPQGFSLQGRLTDATGTTPISGNVTFVIDIYSPDGNCLLYEEAHAPIDLTGKNGKFAISVGTDTGDPARTTDDPGLTMAQIFSNTGGAIRSSASDCPGGYTPAPGDVRGIRMTVTGSSGAPVTLSPDQAIGGVPYALVAETLQGKAPTDFLAATGTVTQSAMNILTGAADASSLHHHDSRYLRSGSVTIQSLGTGGLKSAGPIGIGVANPSVPLDVSGNANIAGNVGVTGNVTINGSGTYSGTWTVASDARFKRDIRDLEGSLERILALRGVSYELRTEKFPERRFEPGRQVGFIAQEVESVVPEVVRTGADGYKSVAYQNLVALLVEAMKEEEARQVSSAARLSRLEAENAELSRRNAELNRRMDQLELRLRSLTGVGGAASPADP